jgi:hypothetical protein
MNKLASSLRESGDNDGALGLLRACLSKNMRFANNEEANKYIKPYLRKGWELKL